MHYSADLFNQQLAARIKAMRQERGWSQADMILLHGYHIADWHALETGRGYTVSRLLRLCEVFGLTMAKLVDGLGELSATSPPTV